MADCECTLHSESRKWMTLTNTGCMLSAMHAPYFRQTRIELKLRPFLDAIHDESADDIPDEYVQKQKNSVELRTTLTWWTGSPCQIKLEWKSMGKCIGDTRDNVRPPNFARGKQ